MDFADNSSGPECTGKPGLRRREGLIEAAQLGARGLWAADRSGQEPESASLLEMLAVTSYLGDLGQVIDLKEAERGASICTGAEGHSGATEMRHMEC